MDETLKEAPTLLEWISTHTLALVLITIGLVVMLTITFKIVIPFFTKLSEIVLKWFETKVSKDAAQAEQSHLVNKTMDMLNEQLPELTERQAKCSEDQASMLAFVIENKKEQEELDMRIGGKIVGEIKQSEERIVGKLDDVVAKYLKKGHDSTKPPTENET